MSGAAICRWTRVFGARSRAYSAEFFPAAKLSARVVSIYLMDDDLELPVSTKRSPLKGMERVIGVPPRLDHAIMLVAGGAPQKAAAAAAAVSPSRLSAFLRTERGSSRLDFWLRQKLRSLGPKAVNALDRNLGSKNAMASVRSAESILDRIGLDGGAIKLGGDLIVTFDFSNRPKDEQARIIDHD